MYKIDATVLICTWNPYSVGLFKLDVSGTICGCVWFKWTRVSKEPLTLTPSPFSPSISWISHMFMILNSICSIIKKLTIITSGYNWRSKPMAIGWVNCDGAPNIWILRQKKKKYLLVTNKTIKNFAKTKTRKVNFFSYFTHLIINTFILS